MGLFTRSAGKPTRAEKKADAKVAKAAQQVAKAEAKIAEAESRAAVKIAAVQTKAQQKAQKAADKTAEKLDAEAKTVERAAREPMTAKRAKRLIGVGQVVLPVLAPYALATVNTVRAAWDARKASRLGVASDQLSAFSGPGGALHARLSHIADALNKLDTDNGAGKAFAEQTRPRIADLSVAVRAAEQMPAPRRRAAFKAISNELDVIESTLLGHLGVTT